MGNTDTANGSRGVPLRMLIEASSIVAAALYAYGWVIASFFYGEFDVTPEDVGVSFSFVTIRVFFVIAAAAALTALAWLGLRYVAQRLPSLTIPRARRAWFELPLACLAVVTMWIVVIGRLTGGLAMLLLLPTFVASIALTGVIFIRLYADGDENAYRVPFGRVFNTASWVAVTLAFLVLLVTPVEVADELANDVREGREIELRPLFGITLMHVDRVHAVIEGVGVTIAPCVALLGSAGGTVVLYDDNARKVVRLPQSDVVLMSPC